MPVRKSTLDLELPDEIRWSVRIGSPRNDHTLFEHEPDAVCATASIGKILLLMTVARRLADGELDATRPVSRLGVQAVADSGLWQHLASDELPIADVCCLVGATSDNLATNVLVELVGLDAVAATGDRLGLTVTGLHDFVRDERRPEHPPALSTGSANELYDLCCELAEPRTVPRSVTETVTGWLSLNTDLSMVAGSFGLDPLAHVNPDRGMLLWNKTGTNVGVRCDVGLASSHDQQLAFAVLANWQVSDARDERRDDVLQAMRALGNAARAWLAEATP